MRTPDEWAKDPLFVGLWEDYHSAVKANVLALIIAVRNEAVEASAEIVDEYQDDIAQQLAQRIRGLGSDPI